MRMMRKAVVMMPAMRVHLINTSASSDVFIKPLPHLVHIYSAPTVCISPWFVWPDTHHGEIIGYVYILRQRGIAGMGPSFVIITTCPHISQNTCTPLHGISLGCHNLEL